MRLLTGLGGRDYTLQIANNLLQTGSTRVHMKKLLLIAVPALLIAACGKAPGPGDTVLEMYKKICETQSIRPMVEYAAPESMAVIGMAVQMAEDKDKGPKMKGELAQRCAKGIKVKEEKTDGDTAVVVLQDDEKPTTLRKIDGKWKITISKNDKSSSGATESPKAAEDESGKGGKPASQTEACVDTKIAQVRKEIGPDAPISRMILTEIDESCGVKS